MTVGNNHACWIIPPSPDRSVNMVQWMANVSPFKVYWLVSNSLTVYNPCIRYRYIWWFAQNTGSTRESIKISCTIDIPVVVFLIYKKANQKWPCPYIPSWRTASCGHFAWTNILIWDKDSKIFSSAKLPQLAGIHCSNDHIFDSRPGNDSRGEQESILMLSKGKNLPVTRCTTYWKVLEIIIIYISACNEFR